MRSDSPPPSWYEPPSWTSFEDWEPDEVAPPADDLLIVAGACSWYSTLAHADDD